jgi:hypothetical protein
VPVLSRPSMPELHLGDSTPFEVMKSRIHTEVEGTAASDLDTGDRALEGANGLGALERPAAWGARSSSRRAESAAARR